LLALVTQRQFAEKMFGIDSPRSGPIITIPVPWEMVIDRTLARLAAPDTLLLGRFLFAVLLIALTLLALLNVTLTLSGRLMSCEPCAGFFPVS